MSKFHDMAIKVDVPLARNTAIYGGTASGIVCFATAATSQRYNIPSDWRGKYVTFCAVTLDIQVAWGASSVSVTLNQASSVASNVITINAATGFPVPAGTSRNFVIPDNTQITDFAVVASGTTGYWFAYVSGGGI